MARATSVTDSMIEASALALSESLTVAEVQDDLLYPRITRIREISAHVALKVIRTAQKAVSALSTPIRPLPNPGSRAWTKPNLCVL